MNKKLLKQLGAVVALLFLFCEVAARNSATGLLKPWELAAGALVFLLFLFEKQIICFERWLAARCPVLLHNAKAAVVRRCKRSARLMAWLNEDRSISAQIEKENSCTRVEIYNDWRVKT